MAITDDLLFDKEAISAALKEASYDVSRLSGPIMTRPSGLGKCYCRIQTPECCTGLIEGGMNLFGAVTVCLLAIEPCYLYAMCMYAIQP